MTKLEMLFVRACKSLNPDKRVLSVYRRFYYKNYNPDPTIVGILLNICETYCPISTRDLVNELNPNKFMLWENIDKPYWTLVKEVLISHIRLSEAKKFPKMIKPLIFRKEKEL